MLPDQAAMKASAARPAGGARWTAARAGLSRLAMAGASAAIALATPACGLDAIDRKTNRLVAAATEAIGAPAAPSRTYSPLDSYERPGQAQKYVETLNPPPENLAYPTVEADLSVAGRLDQFLQYGEIDEEGALRIDLQTAFRIAQRSAREYLNEEEEYILSAIRLLIERHRYSPRFFNTLSANFSGDLADGGATALQIINEFRVTQRLPFGGQVEAALLWEATEQLRDTVAGGGIDFEQRGSLQLSADVPLLRDAGLIAEEDLIQAERDVIYAARDFERFRREFLVNIATDFLGLVAQLQQIDNQKRSIASLERSLAQTAAQVEAGRQRPSARNRIAQSLDQARSQLINITERYLVSLDQFKIRLGIPVTTDVVIEPSGFELPEPSSTPAEATEYALRFRLDLQNDRDQLDDSRRNVANARNQLLPDLDVAAQANFRADPGDRTAGLDLTADASDWSTSVTFGLPLDREIERLNLRSAILNLNREIRSYEQFRDQVILESRSARRQIDQQRVSLDLAIGNVRVNQLTLEEFEIRTDVDPFDLTDAEEDLLRAENERDARDRDLQIAILEYLLSTGQMRVGRDGQFIPIGEMPSPKLDAPHAGELNGEQPPQGQAPAEQAQQAQQAPADANPPEQALPTDPPAQQQPEQPEPPAARAKQAQR